MADQVFQGWRITLGDDGKTYFSNRPLVDEAKTAYETGLGATPPEIKTIGIPDEVLAEATKMRDRRR